MAATLKLRTTSTPPAAGGGRTVVGSNLSNQQVDENFLALDEDKLALSGGTMTGFITLHSNPSSSMQAATKASSEAAAAAAVTAHEADSSAVHAASAISNTPAGNIAATDVQAALNELDTEKLALAGGTMTGNLTLAGAPSSSLHAATKAYVDAAVPVLAASGVTFTPAGDIAAANVQAALEELDNEKEPLLGFTPVNKAGDTLTGALILSPEDLSTAQHAVYRAYADNIAHHATQQNLIINGDFSVWQTTTSIAFDATRRRAADCWWIQRNSNGSNVTCSRVAASAMLRNDSSSFMKKRYSMKVQRTAGDTSTSSIKIAQSIETMRCAGLYNTQGVFCYLLVAIRKGANYSGGTFNILVQRGSGTDGNILDTLTSPATIHSSLNNISSYSAGDTIYIYGAIIPDASMTEMGIRMDWSPSGTAGADDTIYIDAVQIIPSLPSSFDPTFITRNFLFRDELETLQMCKRYVQKSFAPDVMPAQNVGTTNAHFFGQYVGASTAQNNPWVPFMVEMRAAPTVTLYNPSAASGQIRNVTRSTNFTSSSAANAGVKGFMLSGTTPSGSAIGDTNAVHWDAKDANF